MSKRKIIKPASEVDDEPRGSQELGPFLLRIAHVRLDVSLTADEKHYSCVDVQTGKRGVRRLRIRYVRTYNYSKLNTSILVGGGGWGGGQISVRTTDK